MSEGCGAKSFAVGFLAGAALGAVGALLMAPMAGSKLRQELSQKGRRLSSQASEAVGEMRDRGSEVYASAAEVVADAARNLKNAAQPLSR